MIKKIIASVRGEGVSETTALDMEIVELSALERVKKTLLWVGAFIALGLTSAFIPVLHFVSVPTFALLALGALILVPLTKEKILRAEALCPYCQRTTTLNRASVQIPFRDSCEHCHQLLYVEN